MVSKVFLDANVLLDLTLERRNYSQALVLFNRVLDGQIDAYISPSVVHISAHWLTKFRGHQYARQVLLTLLNDVQILEMDHDITVLALGSHLDDIEDALQYYTALNHKVEVFISQDKQMKKSALPTLPVMTVDEFLKSL